MKNLLRDLGYALRGYRKRPSVTLIAALSIAAGIGINAATFSIVDALFWRPLPVEKPEQLVRIDSRDRGGHPGDDSYRDYLDIRAQTTAFSGLIAQSRRGSRLLVDGERVDVYLTVVSDNYFPVLGLRPAAGRFFNLELDGKLNQEPAVVIGYRLWQQRFGGNRDLIGKSVVLRGRHYTVVGVTPPAFNGLVPTVVNDVWVPAATWASMGNGAELEDRGIRAFELLGRLRPGVSREQAQAQLTTIVHGLSEIYPGTNSGRLATAEPVSRDAGALPLLLIAIAGLVLLIACANVATIMLAQVEVRRRELGVRLALGAARGRLTRQLMTESTMLAVAGTALGLLFSFWLIQVVPSLLPAQSSANTDLGLRLDSRVLAFTSLLAFLATLLAGTVPAWKAARTDLLGALKGERGGSGARMFPFATRDVLVGGQIVLSTILLVVAGLLLRSLDQCSRIQPGFDSRKTVLAMGIAAGRPRNDAEVAVYCSELAERLRTLSGVRQASYARRLPLSGSGGGAVVEVSVPGVELPDGRKVISVPYNQVAANYFSTVGVRILRGRPFDSTDGPNGAKVTLVNQTMARRFWPDEEAVGRMVQIGGVAHQIVGIVEDGRNQHLREPPAPYLYFPFAQRPCGDVTFLIETWGNAGAMTAAIKREMRQTDASVEFLGTMTLRQFMDDALWVERALVAIGSTVGFMSILLAGIGLYGGLSFFVNQRRREIGVRLAVGAQRLDILCVVLRRVSWLALIALPIGLGGAYAAARCMESVLYEVNPADPFTFAAASSLVLGVILMASSVPAYRASRVDPVITLRYE